jgi:hypothetical protein
MNGIYKMAKRPQAKKKSKKTNVSWQQIILAAIAIFMIVSMLISMLFLT